MAEGERTAHYATGPATLAGSLHMVLLQPELGRSKELCYTGTRCSRDGFFLSLFEFNNGQGKALYLLHLYSLCFHEFLHTQSGRSAECWRRALWRAIHV